MFEGYIDEFINLSKEKRLKISQNQAFKDTKKVTDFGFQNNTVSESIVQNWTRSALDCYKLNCRCDLCSIHNSGYSFKCQMKRIVEILLKTKGLPDEAAICNPETAEQEVA